MRAAARHPLPELRLADVAADLDVSVPALYRYFRDREALLQAVADHAADSLVLPPPSPDWRGWLHTWVHALRDNLLAHPCLLDPSSWPAVARTGVVTMEPAMRVLLGAGFDRLTALDIYSLVARLAWDFAHTRLIAQAHGPTTREYIQDYLDRGDADRAGPLPALVEDIVHYDEAPGSERQLTMVIQGLPEPPR